MWCGLAWLSLLVIQVKWWSDEGVIGTIEPAWEDSGDIGIGQVESARVGKGVMANHVAAHVVCSFDCLWGRMSTRPNTDLASIIEASVEASVDASVEPRHGSIEARHGSVEEATKHPGTQARNGQRKQDRIRAIEASSIEASSNEAFRRWSEYRSEYWSGHLSIQASFRSIEASSIQAIVEVSIEATLSRL
jgi:hypothetical protein